MVTTGVTPGVVASGLSGDWTGCWCTPKHDSATPAAPLTGRTAVRDSVLSTVPCPSSGTVTGSDHFTVVVHSVEASF